MKKKVIDFGSWIESLLKYLLTLQKQTMPERIYSSHYGNVYFLVLSCCKVNIAENPIAVMGL